MITNSTNLYSQAQFPSMDLAVTFHMGLCLRNPRSEERRTPAGNIIPFGAVFMTLRETSDALGQAQNIADYQAIGMRSREVLLPSSRRPKTLLNGPMKQHRSALTFGLGSR